MANPFGGPSAGTAFGVGLASSLLDTFKTEHDKRQEEERHNKELDFEVIMQTIRDPVWQETHTPSQRQYMMEKAIDLLKPKGHTGIKENLKQIFGGGPQYQPQAGNILRGAEGRPRANVQMPVQTAPVGTGEARPRTVTLPPPPQFKQEQTYGEMDIEAEARKQQEMLNRQMTMEMQREEFRDKQRREQNAAILDRYKRESGIREDAKAVAKIEERAALFGDPKDPMNQERARTSLTAELNQKREESKLKIQVMQERIKKIDSDIASAQTRLRQSAARLSITQKKALENDPQVKGAWVKVREYANQAKTLRTQAAILHGKFAKDGDDAVLQQANDLEMQAVAAETAMQGVINKIEERQNATGVRLPNPPTGRRGAAKLTEAEIRAAGGTDKDVAEAKRRGVLAQ